MDLLDFFEPAIDIETRDALSVLFENDSDYDSFFDHEESDLLIPEPARKTRDIVLMKPPLLSDEWFDLCREHLRKYRTKLRLLQLKKLTGH